MNQDSRAKAMADILNRWRSKEKVSEENTESAGKAAELPVKKKNFEIRGLLYKKLFKPIQEVTFSGRAGHLIALQKKEIESLPHFTISKSKGLVRLISKQTVQTKSMIYPLIRPYSYADIKMDAGENSLVYNVIEPSLTEEEAKTYSKLKEGLMQLIDVSMDEISNQEKMMDYVEKSVRILLSEYGYNVNAKEYLKIMYFISRDFMGLNEIEPLLNDPYIEDIACDGTGVPIYVVHQRYGSLKTSIIFRDAEYLKDFVTKLAERCDRYISYAEPLLDGTLPDGTRIQASLSDDVTTRGPTFSIRKFRQSPFTPTDILNVNTASVEMLAYLWFAVENGSNILVSGGVSTGKTSFLNMLSMFIGTEAKIVSIEDTRELSLPHENWIPGVARVGFPGSNIGEVSMFDLLKESFRQNPDYLIVGEIRGKEAYVMFQAMSSGHPSISTMHAGSVDDVIKRLSTEPINISPGMLEVLDMVVIMIHARDRGKSARRVKEVVEIESVDTVTGSARTSKPFVWIPSLDTFEYRGNSWILHKISINKGIPMEKIMADIEKRKNLLKWMADKNINNMAEVGKYIEIYAHKPDYIEKLISGDAVDRKNQVRSDGIRRTY